MGTPVSSYLYRPCRTYHFRLSRIRAIVADDAEPMREFAALILEKEGVEVVGKVYNGVLAVEVAKALAPDLVVIDADMPQMSGLEAISRIKQQCPTTKVVVISSEDHLDLVVGALDCGADGFV